MADAIIASFYMSPVQRKIIITAIFQKMRPSTSLSDCWTQFGKKIIIQFSAVTADLPLILILSVFNRFLNPYNLAKYRFSSLKVGKIQIFLQECVRYSFIFYLFIQIFP